MSRASRSQRLAALGAAVALSACSESSTSSLVESPVITTTTTATCTPAQALTAGQSITGITGTSVCVGGVSTAAEYALVAFNSAPTSSASFTVSATDVTAPSASTDLIAASGASLLGASVTSA